MTLIYVQSYMVLVYDDVYMTVIYAPSYMIALVYDSHICDLTYDCHSVCVCVCVQDVRDLSLAQGLVKFAEGHTTRETTHPAALGVGH